MSGYIAVHILDVPYHIDRPYDYFVPDGMENEAVPGAFVTVPFGAANRRVSALAVERRENCDYRRVKPVLAVNGERFSLDRRQLELCFYLKRTCLCTVGEAARTLLPSAAFSSLAEFYLPGKADPSSLSPTERAVCDYVRREKKVSAARVKTDCGEEAGEILTRLCRSGHLLRDLR